MTISLLASLLSVIAPRFEAPSAEAAPSPKAFDPGLIISDSVFFDFGTMSVAKIQSFLKSKVSSCASSNPKCLTEYRGDSFSTVATSTGCSRPIKGKKNITAAQMIYDVAQACRINPQVLLVTLQKERALVTKAKPTTSDYKVALGYACPDTSPCSEASMGFFNQLFSAARQFNSYVKNSAWKNRYPEGKTSEVRYSPTASCGVKAVKIKSQATRALYIYTPYTPNAAALNSLYGTGDTCSTYGNRNFWVLFHDWFGSTLGGGYLVKSKAGKSTYLIVNDVRYSIPNSNKTLLAAYTAAFGKPGVTSSAYIDSFALLGPASRLVRDDTGKAFLVEAGKRYELTGGCAEAAGYGLDCAAAPVLSSSQLTVMPSAGVLSHYAKAGATGKTFLIKDGRKHEVADRDPVLLASAGLTLPEGEASAYPPGLLSAIPYGPPVIAPDTYVKGASATNRYYYTAGIAWRFNKDLRAQVKADSWFGKISYTLDDGSLTAIGVQDMPAFLTTADSEATYLLAKNGLVTAKNPRGWTKKATVVPDSLAAKIPTLTTAWAAPVFVRADGTKTVYLVTGATKQKVATTKLRTSLAKTYGMSTSVKVLPKTTVSAIKTGPTARIPGTVVKVKSHSQRWILDGAGNRSKVSLSLAKELLGAKVKTVAVSSAQLKKYTAVTPNPTIGVQCHGKNYLAVSGKLLRVRAAAQDHFAAKIKFRAYDDATCAKFTLSTASIGTVLKSGSSHYLIDHGTKTKISKAKATQLATSFGTIRTVSAYVVARFPNSTATPSPLLPPAPPVAEAASASDGAAPAAA